MDLENQKKDSWYERQFARYYDGMMQKAEQAVLGSRRQQLLSSTKGSVLEIGCGTGVNFEYYHPEASVLAFDPSRSMLKQAERRANQARAEINLLQMPAEDLDQLEDSFTTIVSTLVLCTVQNPELVLENLFRLLKPGGKLLVLEHIRSHNSFVAIMQSLIRPAWQCCGAGCVLNRPTDQLLKNWPGLSLLQEEYFKHSLPFYQAQFQK